MSTRAPRIAAAFAVLPALLAPVAAPAAPKPSASASTLVIRVLDSHRQALPGARVSVSNRAASAVTGASGRASLRVRMLGRQQALVTLRIRHPRGRLVEREVPLAAADRRRLRVELRGGRVERYFAGVPRSRIGPLQAAADRRARRALRRGATASSARGMCSGHNSLSQPPSSIRVARRTNNSPSGAIYRIDTVDYQLYTRRVLAQEWIPSWNMESLRAGSLAVKAYAWNRAVTQNERSWNGQCFDVDDSVNYQVYRESTAGSTDSAVSSVWRTWVRKNNQTFWAGYTAGSPGMACGADNEGGTRMRQWGTKTCADQGKSYRDITDDYYFPVSFFTLDVAPFGNELAFVARQYLDFYGRPIPAPDAAWLIAALWNGQGASAQIDGVFKSAEAKAELHGVVRLYYTAFDRHPDGGARTWLNRSLQSVATGLLNSNEGQSKLPANPENYVRALYRGALNRTPNSSEVGYWADQVRSKGRAAVMVAISESSEHKNIRRGLAETQALYVAMLHRGADAGARDYWVPILRGNAAASWYLVETIRLSAEYNRLVN